MRARSKAETAARLWLFGPAIAWTVLVALGVVATALNGEAWVEVDRSRSDVEGSEACRSCHPGAYESWHRSYHRTMTQPVGAPEVVVAPFAGESIDYLGFRATLTGGAATPRVTVTRLAEDGEERGEPVLAAEVVMTVGSHRYQQYLARIDRGGGPEEVWRLPVAWHIGERRWIHMNAAFLEPEGAPGSEGDYLRHLSRWNDNCALCHNTEPVPGLQDSGEFRTELGEIGIACEACHGPASDHLARHRNPLRRMLGAADVGDGSIAHPGRLSPRDESGVCGRCHGNRISADVASVLREGDGFLPGTPLSEVSRPIFRDSELASDPEGSRAIFQQRFWPDGSPRLSAYEYQGLLLSPCYQEEAEAGARGLGCNHGHDMHGDEPALQVRAGRQGDGACLSCHARDELGGAAGAGGHGGHGDAISCLDCHMPRTTYGLLQGMINHRITSPDPGALVGRDDQPDACTQCHVERSRSWAAGSMAALGLTGTDASANAPAASESWAPRVVLDLHGGDPLQRGLATQALARPEATGDPRQRMAWLVDGLEDEYPAVRWMAWRGLKQLVERGAARSSERSSALRGALADFDHLAEPSERLLVIDRLRASLGPGAFAEQPDRREALLAKQERVILWIGE